MIAYSMDDIDIYPPPIRKFLIKLDEVAGLRFTSIDILLADPSGVLPAKNNTEMVNKFYRYVGRLLLSILPHLSVVYRK